MRRSSGGGQVWGRAGRGELWSNLDQFNFIRVVIKKDIEMRKYIGPAEDVWAGRIFRKQASDFQFVSAYLDLYFSKPDSYSFAAFYA